MWGAGVSEVCHLRQLVEQAESKRLLINDDMRSIPKTSPSEAIAQAIKLADNAVCFHMGSDDTCDHLRGIPGMFRLPFDVCWFEMNLEPRADRIGRMGVLALQVREGQIGYWVFATTDLNPGIWGLIAFCPDAHESKSPEGRPAIYGKHWPASFDVGYVSGSLWGYLSAMYCSNVERQEHKPADKLQKARAKRGKAPLFSYWTLQLRGRQEKGQPLGGTHAGPRVHLRRGHPRQFAPGRWTWVQPHAVGNKAAGMVHKDYDGSRLANGGHSTQANA